MELILNVKNILSKKAHSLLSIINQILEMFEALNNYFVNQYKH